MNNWKVIFATVVIFGAGVITGGLLVNYAQLSLKKVSHGRAVIRGENRSGGRMGENGKPRPPEILCKQFLQKLNRPLHLTAKQRQQIRKIISDGQNQIRKAVQDARLEIREVLTPEQRKEFDKLIRRPFRKPIYNTNSPALLLQHGTNSLTGTHRLPL